MFPKAVGRLESLGFEPLNTKCIQATTEFKLTTLVVKMLGTSENIFIEQFCVIKVRMSWQQLFACLQQKAQYFSCVGVKESKISI